METTDTTPTTGSPLIDGLIALTNADRERYKQPPKQNVGAQVFSLMIGIFAGYLSWTCNTIDGVDTPMKVFYAFFAFSFGSLYLIYYAATRGFKVCK
jgi:hypothetical protein